MYVPILTLHSILRWVVVLSGVWAVVAARRAAGRSPWTAGDARPGLLFVLAIDIQLLLGLALYLAASPITRAAIADIGAAMSSSPMRFWAVEHPAAMILAVVFAHLGRTLGRTPSPGRRVFIWYGLALLAILAATPWPFMPQARPWVRI
jgi:hypothetical protein